jgi:hypothetical protein
MRERNDLTALLGGGALGALGAVYAVKRALTGERSDPRQGRGPEAVELPPEGLLGWVLGQAAAATSPALRVAALSPASLLGEPVPGLRYWGPPEPGPDPARPSLTEELSLGKVITSEAGDGIPAERAAVGWVTRNRAKARGTTIARMVCWPECGPCCKGRPMSSARGPATQDLALARAILRAPESEDPTRGATSFFEPVLQDRLVREGRPGYRLTAAQVREKWLRDGLEPVAYIGRFETWRRKRTPLG